MRISFRLIGRMAFAAGLVALCTNAASAPQEKIDFGSLKAVKTVNPVYPEAVKEEGIAGEVVIWAGIDRQGNVRHPSVFRPLHPALDQAALEAVSQWKFEPVFHAGEPIAFLTYISVVFDPGDPGPEKGLPAESPLPVGVRSVLGVAAEYGMRLNSAARFYTCRERIEGSVKTVGEGSAASIGTMLGEG
jgi:TonB family protein